MANGLKDITFIYHTDRNSDISANRVASTINYEGVDTQFYFYDAAPDRELSGIKLSVQDTASVIVFRGESGGQPVTRLGSVDVGETDVYLAFDATTFGSTDADRLLVGLVPDGMTTPTIPMDDISYYEVMIGFHDNYFNQIIPEREDRGGGVIELADGSLVQHKGFGGNRWRWQLRAPFVDREMLDRLDALFADRPEFFFAEEPERYPDRVYQCVLERPIFRVPYSSSIKENGYTVELQIAQV